MSDPKLKAEPLTKTILREIGALVAEEFKIPFDLIFSNTRKRVENDGYGAAFGRHAVSYIADVAYEKKLAQNEIARGFGELITEISGEAATRDHTTIRHSVLVMTAHVESDNDLKVIVDRIKTKLLEKYPLSLLEKGNAAAQQPLPDPTPPPPPPPPPAPPPAAQPPKAHEPTVPEAPPPARAKPALDYAKEFAEKPLSSFKLCEDYPALLQSLTDNGFEKFGQLAAHMQENGSYAPSRLYRFLAQESLEPHIQVEKVMVYMGGQRGFSLMALALSGAIGIIPRKAFAPKEPLPAAKQTGEAESAQRPQGAAILPDGATGYPCTL